MSITLLLVILTGLVSYQAFSNSGLFHKLKHYPVIEAQSGEYYRFITSGFVHANWMHLLVNMYVLYFFGEVVENNFVELFGNMGRIVFLLMYLSAIVVADLQSFFRHKNNPAFASIGASGAVSAVVFIYIVFFPWSMLSLFPLVFIQFPAILGGVVYLIYSSWASKKKSGRINHSAHFYGAVYGVLFILTLKPQMIDYFIQTLIQGFPY